MNFGWFQYNLRAELRDIHSFKFIFYTMIAVLFDIAITSIHIVYVIICICAKISNDISCASYYSAIINYTSALGRMQCPIKSYPWKGQAIAMLLTDQFSIYLCWDTHWTKRKMYPPFGCAFWQIYKIEIK